MVYQHCLHYSSSLAGGGSGSQLRPLMPRARWFEHYSSDPCFKSENCYIWLRGLEKSNIWFRHYWYFYLCCLLTYSLNSQFINWYHWLPREHTKSVTFYFLLMGKIILCWCYLCREQQTEKEDEFCLAVNSWYVSMIYLHATWLVDWVVAWVKHRSDLGQGGYSCNLPDLIVYWINLISLMAINLLMLKFGSRKILGHIPLLLL